MKEVKAIKRGTSKAGIGLFLCALISTVCLWYFLLYVE
jgi:hypothetical protein